MIDGLEAKLLEASTFSSDQDPVQLEAGLVGDHVPALRVQVSNRPTDAELVEVGRLVVNALQLRRAHELPPWLIVVVRPGKPEQSAQETDGEEESQAEQPASSP